MSIVKLTQNLKNFKWTDYESIGSENNPQSFDGVTGQKSFNRPNQKSLADMESKFGPKSSDVGTRGPYGVSDVMDGIKKGRTFVYPGGAPLGFTMDMESLEGDVVSQLVVDGEISLTPLSYTVSGMQFERFNGSTSLKGIYIAAGGSTKATPIGDYVSKHKPDGEYAAIHSTDIFHTYEGIEGSKSYGNFDNPFTVPFQHLSLTQTPFLHSYQRGSGLFSTETRYDKFTSNAANIQECSTRYIVCTWEDEMAASFDPDAGTFTYIDDDGQGIPEKERKKVLQPFYRVEDSRNRDTGGIGLGITIAADIINNHGGNFFLDKSPLGGLRAKIYLPI